VADSLVVDTSIWIDKFQARPTPRKFQEALDGGAVVIPPLVAAELISGAHTGEARAMIGEALQESPVHETPLEHWIEVGELRRRLSDRGINISLPDAHIAQCALDLSALLLSRDAVFVAIARHTSLRLYA
jgi:predicted nucleic acid-binding protein